MQHVLQNLADCWCLKYCALSSDSCTPPLNICRWLSLSMSLLSVFFSDGISVTGLPISSPLRQVLKPRPETKSVGGESGKAEYSHTKVKKSKHYIFSALHWELSSYLCHCFFLEHSNSNVFQYLLVISCLCYWFLIHFLCETEVRDRNKTLYWC